MTAPTDLRVTRRQFTWSHHPHRHWGCREGTRGRKGSREKEQGLVLAPQRCDPHGSLTGRCCGRARFSDLETGGRLHSPPTCGFGKWRCWGLWAGGPEEQAPYVWESNASSWPDQHRRGSPALGNTQMPDPPVALQVPALTSGKAKLGRMTQEHVCPTCFWSTDTGRWGWGAPTAPTALFLLFP